MLMEIPPDRENYPQHIAMLTQELRDFQLKKYPIAL